MIDYAKSLVELATQKQKTISSCESLTAGLFTSTIASVSGASQVLKGGLVTYFTEMKKVLAHVDETIIDTYGVISKECAYQMAQKTRILMDSDYCVSFTGNAGPLAMENKPAGQVFCVIATRDRVYEYSFLFQDLSRNDLRKRVVDTMICELIQKLEKE